jgi:primosomal protein N''
MSNPADDLQPLLFPGRTALRVEEIAKRLCVTVQHVRNLQAAGHFGDRKSKLIQHADYERFLRRRSSLKLREESK